MATDSEFMRQVRGLRRSIFGKGDVNLPAEGAALKRKKQQEGAQREAFQHLRNLTKGKPPFGGKK
jgi:hypothetical protein